MSSPPRFLNSLYPSSLCAAAPSDKSDYLKGTVAEKLVKKAT